MAIGEVEAVQAQPVRRRWRLRVTVMGLIGLVALAAVALWFYRRHMSPQWERPAIVASFKKVSPVTDGALGKDEYGPPVMMTWNEGNTLAAFNPTLLDPATQTFRVDPTQSKPPTDLSIEARAAYTNTTLFLAFRVHDQFVDAQESDRTMPMYNDGVEVFIDGDGVFNDFGNDGSMGTGSREGFQLLVNAAGHQFTASKDFTNADWKAAARRTGDGYIVEMEIPLALIDTKDGPPVVPPGPGTLLNLGLAVTDNDAEVSRQMSYAYLRTPNQTMSSSSESEGSEMIMWQSSERTCTHPFAPRQTDETPPLLAVHSALSLQLVAQAPARQRVPLKAGPRARQSEVDEHCVAA